MPRKNLPNLVRPLRLLWDVQSDNADDEATIFLRGTRDSFYAAAAALISKANQFTDVASVDVLQTDEPAHFDNSIQSALMDVGTQLLAMASLQLRQNTESPCILEVSEDGGATWTTFADLTLCAPAADRLLRYNPATDTVQSSTDGGATWTDDPSADPRSGAFNARPLLTGDDVQCTAANHMLAAFDAYFTKIIAEADVGLAVVGVSEALLVLFSLFLGGLPFVIDIVITAATAAVGLGVAGLSSAWSTHKDAVFCILYCHIGSDGSVTSDDVAAIKAQIDSDVGGIVAGHLDSLLGSWGNIGLQNAGTVDEGETPLDCTSCTCGSSWEFYSDEDFDSGFRGHCDSGDWKSTGRSTGHPLSSEVMMRIALTTSEMTSISITYTKAFGTNDEPSQDALIVDSSNGWYDGTLIDAVNPSTGNTGGIWSWTGSQVVSDHLTIWMFASCGTPSGHVYGTVDISHIEIVTAEGTYVWTSCS